MLSAILFFIHFVNAAETRDQACSLKGDTVLQAPTQFFCMKDMKIADGTRIITQGYPLTITAVGSINYGEPPAKGYPPPRYPGLRIFSFKTPAPQSQAAGPIYIYGNTSFGTLEIHNHGASERDLSGEVIIEYVTRGKSYSQTVDVAPGTKVELVVNGFPLEPKAPVASRAGERPVVASNETLAPQAKAAKPKVHKPRVRKLRPMPPQNAAPPPPFWNWSW